MPLLPRRLNTRIVLVVSFILLATGASFGWVTAGRQATSLLDAMRRSASMMVRNVAATSAHQLLIEDYAQLGELLAGTVALPDIQRLVVCEPDGKLIWDIQRNPNGPPQWLTGITRVSTPANVAQTMAIENDQLVIWQPIEAGKPLGWLKAEYSLASIRAGQAQIWKDAWLMTVAWVAGSALLIFLLLNPILQSISRLTAFSKQLNERKGERITLPDNILEIAELGVSLNEASVKLFSTEQQLIQEREQLRDAEQKVRALNAELEARVQHRTAELEVANAELVLARDNAAAASRAKSIFLANMSHELRTPLNAILGFAQLMERDATLPEDKRSNLHTINKSGQHLLALINDVLEISKIEAGRQQLLPATVDLKGVLSSLTESLSLRARDNGTVLKLETADDLPPYIDTDVAKLRQILLNLLSNAIKFTQAGTITLSAGVLNRIDGQATLEFRVSDTGIGMNKEELQSIFATFYQAAAGVRQGEGTGLGLAISREYAKLLGGELTAESTPGQGSTFRFTLPTSIVASPTQESAEGPVKALTPGQPEYRILIAEDEPVNQKLLQMWMEDVGFVVRVANNGQEAVELFTSWQPHFIWMDMRMPVMDGFEATRTIRDLPEGKAIPIVAFTASAFEEDRRAIVESGCNDVMTKPLDEKRMFGLMSRYLGVGFDYETAHTEVSCAIDASIVPQAVRTRIYQTAEQLDAQEVKKLAREIEAEFPAVARRILELADLYQFDAICQCIGQSGKQ